MKTSNPKNELAQTIPGLASLAHEDNISIDLTPVERENGDNEINKCRDCLTINGRAFGDKDRPINDITGGYAVFSELFKEATELGNSTSNYATGLRMHFGLIDDKICLIYQPVRFDKSSDKETFRTYHVTDGGYYQYTDENGFEPHANLTCLGDYERGIGTKRHDTDLNFAPYDMDIDITAATYSFQEIFALVNHNQEYGDTVSVFNAIRGDGGINNHSVLLGVSIGPSIEGILTGKYANLAHLCPPNCPQVKYNLN